MQIYEAFSDTTCPSLLMAPALCLVLAVAPRPAGAQFPESVITPFADGGESVYATDVDGDGHTDVLSASSNDDKIAWYENDGSESFTPHTITTSASSAESVFAADIDGDGHTDVLSASAGDDKIEWYENDGSESFTAHTITTAANFAGSVFAADIDGDGHTDVLSASNGDDKIAWYENDGGSNPSFTTHTITTGASSARSVYARDVDGDGDTDVLSASRDDDKIAWYENDGNADPSFTTREITTSADGAFSVFARDVDGDGDTDVLSASAFDDKIAWYENDGASNPSFTAHTITTGADAAVSVFARDVDGDGDTDVLSASSGDNKIAWYENDGTSTPSFTTHTITTGASSARSVYARDVDGDSHVDVLSASFSDDKIAWYENDGSSDPSFTTHEITTNADRAQSVFATDVDGDSDTDVLSASEDDSKIAWYENDGSQSFTPHTITTSASSAQSVYATDVDGDGDTDVLSASDGDDKIAWYENDGTSTPSFTAHTITTSANSAQSVYATDVDVDGDTDVLSASEDDSKIAWYENDGTSTPSFTTHTITTNADFAQSVFATDVDGDGDTDVLSASLFDDKIAWYENDGTSSFGTTHEITTNADQAFSVYATDVDGDGDADVLSASAGDDKIAWYENDGGSNPSFSAHTITTSANSARSVFAQDIDGDGHTDVLSASDNDDKIAWYENDGGSNPSFTAHTITTSANSARSVYATDVDGDGHTDVLSASFSDDKIAWYENTVVVVVNDDGSETTAPCNSADASTVSGGISQATSDQNVRVCPGTYSESTLDVTRDVALRSNASLSITDELTLSSAALHASSGGTLTLKSTSETSVAAIAGTGSGTVTGEVTFERYLDKGDDASHFRMLSAPTATALDDEGSGSNSGSLLSNMWTQSDGSGDTGADANGADNSIFIYDEGYDIGSNEDLSDGWAGVTDLNSGTGDFNPGTGFLAFLFADRDPDDGTTEGFPATLSATGTVQAEENSGNAVDLSGQITFTDDDDTDDQNGWNLIANPFMAPIDWESIENDGSDLTNVDKTIYVWDAANGAYATYTADGSPGGTGTQDQYIAPFQAFFVKANGSSPDIGGIDAGDKAIGENPEFKSKTTATPQIALRLRAESDSTGETTVVRYAEDASEGKDAYDAYQLEPLSATRMLIASEMDGTDALFDHQNRPEPAEVDTVDLALDITESGTYTLEASTLENLPLGWNVMLEDADSGTRYDLGAGESVTFEVTAPESAPETTSAASGAAAMLKSGDPTVARAKDGDDLPSFRLLVGPSSAIPVELAAFDVTTKGTEVQLSWQTASETNNAGFEVQRKAAGEDGAEWTEVGFVESKATGGTTNEPRSYRFTDEDLPFSADRPTYRLRQVDTDGSEHFSDEVTVERTVEVLRLEETFPNPALGQATVQFAVPERQDVRLELYDVLGRQVRTVRQGEAQGREELQVDLSGLASGTYFLRLRVDGEMETQRLTVVR